MKYPLSIDREAHRARGWRALALSLGYSGADVRVDRIFIQADLDCEDQAPGYVPRPTERRPLSRKTGLAFRSDIVDR